ncbi:hypothetical protein B0H63DRAFT_449683 [Podospora didyma]|uniref:Uncharacterized protein n=1 Tax=Podospora didyma TaxID=330526 RepID=A0AAE0TZV5_9PEZI|nr:hypothetical protein B0H63DRAFT_449683 [Podospora didyma]
MSFDTLLQNRDFLLYQATPMTSHYFIHLPVDCPGNLNKATNSRVRINRLPTNRKVAIQDSSKDLVMGWGVHTIEGPDNTTILILLNAVYFSFLAFLIAYHLTYRDWTSTSTLGSLFVAILTLIFMIMTILVIKWR